jgi:hypothetical protein
MKYFLILLIFFPFSVNAQKMIALDRSLQQPLSIVDGISMDEATKGAVAIYVKDVETIQASIQLLIKHLVNRDRQESFDLEMGNSKCVVKIEKHGAVNNYNIVLNTNTGDFKTAFVLVAHESEKKAVQRLTMFLDYLRNNLAVISDFEKL